jgi:hypothetical protein
LDEEAAATRIPASLTAMMNRSASAYAVNSPASMSSITIDCLRSPYVLDRRSASGTPKYSSAACAPLKRGLPDMTCW